jgi:hypothetical protein
MKGIPQQRILLYLLFFGALPTIFVLFSFLSNSSFQSTLHSSLDASIFEVREQNRRELHNTAARNVYQNTERFYIHKELEPFIPLQTEINKLEKHAGGLLNFEEEAIKRRLHFLCTDNGFSFVEGNEQKINDVRETDLSLSHAVEVDLNDIKVLLTKLEGIPIGEELPPSSRPHIIIKEFRLDKKEGFFSETYLLHLKLLQRDYTKL